MTSNPVHFYNYAVGFVDLLGQQDEYRDQNLLPDFDSPQAEEAFGRKVWNTIGAIDSLQKDCRTFLDAALRHKSPDRERLPEELQVIFDQMRISALKTQMWSDGVVYFSSLGDTDVKVPANALFNMIAALGSLCFVGLTKKHPMRGGLEVAWGVELEPGNLYGCAVAKAYELESKIAQYPRIVVGPYYMQCLRTYSRNTGEDVFAMLNKTFADTCLSMLIQDVDGRDIVHYLGDAYQRHIGTRIHQTLYDRALGFIHASLGRFRSEKNEKLVVRYMQLLNYFEKYQPKKISQ